ncbi:MAG: B12-binding domain-containing radical SAM protein [Candidatus Eremiobacteraeota bacterium]|nr:B12-binding domain-containing radical SAM protein [Candidatus Eremiobacteraeota bacterium]
MNKILFTSVCRPFGGKHEGKSVGAELFHMQITRAQGMFSPRQVIRCWALDYIAENIETPSVVLHYPSEAELIRELRTGDFDCVGISFVVSTFHKVERMVRLIRRYRPGAQIILGGYGTVLPDDMLLPLCDHICREEGIAFMRRLLGERLERPIRHPYAPIASPEIFYTGYSRKVMHITGGLGCPNGCDFCCTSHFFKRKYLSFTADGRQLYREMARLKRECGDRFGGFAVIDEDFFIHREKALQYLECVKQNEDDFAMMAFGSVKGLSQFTADEIAMMGVDLLWIGFESEKSDFRKLDGKPIGTLIRELRSRGVAVIASMIIGFPGQDRESIERDFQRLMSAQPDFSQFLIYFAFPGTPLHRYVMEQDLYSPPYRTNPDYRTFDGFASHFTQEHFRPGELESLQEELYRRDYERLGPSVVRAASAWLEGYRNLRDSAEPLLRKRAERKLAALREILPVVYAAAVLGPGRARREEARILKDHITAALGGISPGHRIFCWGAIPMAFIAGLRLKSGFLDRRLRLEKVAYHRKESAAVPQILQSEACRNFSELRGERL